MSNQQYDNTNSGAIFKNDTKKEPKHPDYKGSLNVEGVEYWISGWIKEFKSGKDKFISIKFSRKDAPKDAQKSKPAQPVPASDDDIPF